MSEPTPKATADLAAELYGYMRHPQQSQWYGLPDDKMVYWLNLAAAVQRIFSRLIAEKDAEIATLRDCAADAVAGLRYIEDQSGRLYGVGWDRVYAKWKSIGSPLPTIPSSKDMTGE